MRKRDSKVTREKAKATAAVRTRTRNRHEDVKSLGPSRLVPYDPAEPDSDRHRRRLESAAEHKGSLESWCRQRKIAVSVQPDSSYWVFILTYGKRLLDETSLAHWWPLTARLVFGKLSSPSAVVVHAHDIEQVKAEIKQRFKGLAL